MVQFHSLGAVNGYLEPFFLGLISHIEVSERRLAKGKSKEKPKDHKS
jgi:hypothetical protein